MLYNLFEAQHSMLGPWRHAAEHARDWFAHPFSPFAYSPIARRIAASSDLFLRVTQRYEKPAWEIDDTFVDGNRVAVEQGVEVAKPFCRLVHFRRALPGRAGRRSDPRVLLVAPLSGHHATLLRDTVRSLLPDHEVWVTDWIDARMVPLSAGEGGAHRHAGRDVPEPDRFIQAPCALGGTDRGHTHCVLPRRKKDA